ncbi:MAG: hypothetical protein GY847_06175 [Proteobacteria bacterium]|nr:hypothetical protein [Pseudomonadota bacterium]
MNSPFQYLLCLICFGLLSAPLSTHAVELIAQVDFEAEGTSNVFLDRYREWDIALRPAIDLALDFADHWTIGYSGELSAYIRHQDLLSHWHELYIFVNPVWGDEQENEFVVEAAVETLRNDKSFTYLNLLRPWITSRVSLEPVDWFQWMISAEVAYRWFYDNQSSNSWDAWLEGKLSFFLPSRTTLIPRVAYGYRYQPNAGQDSIFSTQDMADGPYYNLGDAQNNEHNQQLEFGLTVGQGLWKRAGLQAEYKYRLTIGKSALAMSELFSRIGDEFLFSGHEGRLGLKQLLGKGWKLGAALTYQQRKYTSWPVSEDRVVPIFAKQREDDHLTPSINLGYAWSPESDTRSKWIPDIEAGLEYRFTRQWSNLLLYDTAIHAGGISISLGW